MAADDETGPAGGAWFARLPVGERGRFARSVRPGRSYRAGATLFHEGDASDWVVLVSEGRVKVTSCTTDGKDAILAVCAPGELVGELSAIDGSSEGAGPPPNRGEAHSQE